MVKVALHFGQSLGPFSVGQSLLAVTEMVRSRFTDSNASILFGETTSSSHTIIMLVTSPRKDLYVLRFDPALQILRSVTYCLPQSTGKTDVQEIYGSHSLSLKRAIAIRDVIDSFGRPKGFSIHSCRENNSKVAFLVYNGACLVFQLRNPEHREVKDVQDLSELKSRLLEVRVAPKDDSSLCTLWKVTPLARIQATDFRLPTVHMIVHKTSKLVTGLQISYLSDDRSHSELTPIVATRVVRFGDRCEDVLSMMGTPDKAYYKDDQHSKSVGVLGSCLNISSQSGLKSDVSFSYRHLGMDVLFDSGKNMVSKFVLHSNVPDHYEFCHYSRCFFKFSVSKDGVSTSSGIGSSEDLLVTATTNWNVVRTHVDTSLAQRLRTCHYGPSTNSSYLFPDTNLWALFNQFIVEVTDSKSIAKLTILAPPPSVILQSRSTRGTTVVRPSNTPLPVREVETSFKTRAVSKPDKQISQETDSDDEFQDCQEDSFQSAESSLTIGQTPVQLDKDKPKTITVVHTAFFSSNVNTVISNDMPVDSPHGRTEETVPAMSVTFEFRGDDDSDESEHSSATIFTTTTSTYSPDDLEAMDSHLSEVEVPAHTSREHSPELSSFDFVSYSEILESQKSVADVPPSNDEPSILENVPSDGSEMVDSPKVSQAGATSPSSGGDSQALTVDEVEGHSTPPDKVTSESQEMRTSSPESAIHYQPQPVAMTASRTMALSQDIGLMTKSTRNPSRESRAVSRVRFARSPQKKASRAPNVESSPHARTKSDQKGTAKAIAKGGTKPSPVSPVASERQLRKPIIQRRAGSSISAREEAHQRLLSHTKSSQQRVKQKYVPKKVATEEVKEEEEEGERKTGREGEVGGEGEEGGEGEGGEGKREKEGEGKREEIEEKREGDNSQAVAELAYQVEVQPAALIRTEELYVPVCVEEANTKLTDPRNDCKSAHTNPFNPLGPDDTAVLSITDETTITAEPWQGDPPAVNKDPPRDDDTHNSSNAMDLSMHANSGTSSDLHMSESNDSHNAVPHPLSDNSFNTASNSQSPLPTPLLVTEVHVHSTETSQVTLSSEATESGLTSEGATNEHSESRDSTTTGKSADTPDSTESQLLRSSPGEGPQNEQYPMLPSVRTTSESDPTERPAFSPSSPAVPSSPLLDSPRRHWDDEPFMPGFGPPSMTHDRVLLELISCEHEEVCGRLRAREEGLTQLWQILLHPESSQGVGDIDHMTSHDEALLPDMLSVLNQHRPLWDLKFTVSLLPRIKELFLPSVKRRYMPQQESHTLSGHLLAACESVSLIATIHGPALMQYKTGRLRSPSPEDRFRYQMCSEALEEVGGALDRLIPALQHSREGEGEEGVATLRKLGDLRVTLEKIFRKLQLE